MKEEPQKKEAEKFDHMIRSLAAAIKNSALYPPGHPSLSSSIKSFSSDLDSWLLSSDKLELGIAPDNLLVNGEYMRKDGSDLYAEVGSYLHQRGIISLTFKRGITTAEMERLFGVVKSDPKVFQESGGILKLMPASEHLVLREIDYSALLKGAKTQSAGQAKTDKDIWQSLVSLSTGTAGELPLSKSEFLEGFLKNPEGSAAVLNRIYKEALAKVDHKATVSKMRAALTGVAKYFEGHGKPGSGAVQKDIADIILKLDPDLIARLFDEERGDPGEPDLSEEVMSALPDDAVADFMASLAGKEGGLNKQLIKFFDKLVTDKTRSSNITTLVGDKLFNANSMNKDMLVRLQGSFKEMLTSNPDSGFLNEIYKMTLDTFADSGVSQVSRSDEYMRIARDTAEALKDDSLKRQETLLLLNLIWLERDPAQFRKLCDILKGKFDSVLDTLSLQVVRDVYELFTAKLDSKVKDAPEFKEMIAAVYDMIMTDGVILKIIALISEAGQAEMNSISHILVMASPKGACFIVGAYISEPDAMVREKMAKVMTSMGGEVLPELVSRIKAPGGLKPDITAGVFEVVGKIDPKEARSLSGSMLKNKDARIRMQALDAFVPESPGDVEMLIGILKERSSEDIGDKIVAKIMGPRSGAFMDILFKALDHGPLMKRYLPVAVKMCGGLKIPESYSWLEKLFKNKPFFYNKFIDSIRVASIVSLAQLGTPEAMELVKLSVRDPSRAVRRMGSIILELDKENKTS